VLAISRFLGAVVPFVLVGCARVSPGDPGLVFMVTNHCATDIEFLKFTDSFGEQNGRWLPAKIGGSVRVIGSNDPATAYTFVVRRPDKSGEVRFRPETEVVSLVGDHCPSA
jgi:hypothetical protein